VTATALHVCRVVELRQYTLRPGRRDVLIELFDTAFVESQEAVGMAVLGQFRDLDDPDRFVWLRGFPGMDARADSLAEFYGGPVWREHAKAANATMIDVDNVLLLRPYPQGSAIVHDPDGRPATGSSAGPPRLVVATIYPLGDDDAGSFPGFFAREVEPLLAGAGIAVSSCFVTARSPNNFPALPVRENEYVFAWLARYPDPETHARLTHALESTPAWTTTVAPMLDESLANPPEILRLTPTARSRM
jgi:NIPSNAP